MSTRRNQDRTSTNYSSLEKRQVLTTIGFNAGTGVLTFTGDATDDVVMVQYSGGQLQVDATGNSTQYYTASDVTLIEFYGNNGDDQFTNNSAVPVDAFGNLGNDTITGGSGDDYINGGPGMDILAGADGEDFIQGGDDNDVVTGGNHDDDVRGGEGDDYVSGDDGNDRVYGEAGDDELHGGDGEDTLLAFTGNDELNGGADNDWLWGQIGDDIINAGAGNDRVRAGYGEDEVHGGAGNDIISGDHDDDVLNGDDGNDRLIGFDGEDELNGGNDNDSLYGKNGNDTLNGGSGDDLLRGGDGEDRLSGNDGNDRLYGDDDNDRLYGHAGLDFLVGGNGNDGLFGGDFDDVDQLFGNAGYDRFLTQNNDAVRDRTNVVDAVLVFENVSSDWNDVEIEIIDDGFQQLHDRTGNTVLLQDSVDSGDLTFYKYSNLGGAAGINYLSYSYSGNNFFNFRREIRILDWNENSDWYNNQFTDVVIHEIGHNWDSNLEFTQYDSNINISFDDFENISGWTEDDMSGHNNYSQSHDGDWWYDNTTSFAENYGRTNPNEDLATMWEYYFNNEGTSDHGDLASKVHWLNLFFGAVSAY